MPTEQVGGLLITLSPALARQPGRRRAQRSERRPNNREELCNTLVSSRLQPPAIVAKALARGSRVA